MRVPSASAPSSSRGARGTVQTDTLKRLAQKGSERQQQLANYFKLAPTARPRSQLEARASNTSCPDSTPASHD